MIIFNYFNPEMTNNIIHLYRKITIEQNKENTTYLIYYHINRSLNCFILFE